MIMIELSEIDFDYEIQALVNSFFPGQISKVGILQEQEDEGDTIYIRIHMDEGSIGVSCNQRGVQLFRQIVVEKGDWHKKPDKSAHPFRTYYKNQLKGIIFEVIAEFAKKYLEGICPFRIPAWGTMTGVRPTKVAMNELLQGKSEQEVTQVLKTEYYCSDEKAELGIQIASKESALLRDISYEEGYSLYIGIPFCPTTCLYCSFTSYPYQRFAYLVQDYLAALKKEMAFAAEALQGRKLSSIYIGGGTPTTLSAQELRDLIQTIQNLFPVDMAREFTVEAGRPDSITREKLVALRECGVERISVNPQTMQQKTLDLIGRKHTVEQTKDAFLMAKELGFTNINMDLIIGLPDETEQDFVDTLGQIRQLDPDSLTIHSLVVKRASGLRTLRESREDGLEIEYANADRMETMLALGEKYAGENAYLPYYMYRQKNSAGHAGSTGQENIGYARDGKECLYNILIMEEKQTIIALGAGASTKIYRSELDQVTRVENVKSVTDYIERIDEMIARKKAAFEQYGI